VTLLLAIGFALTALTVAAPQVVALLGVCAIYMNVAGVAVTAHGMPRLVAAATFLLLLGPWLVRTLVRREGMIVDRPLLLMVAFLGAVLLSFFAVKDYDVAIDWVQTFLVEGLLVYFLVLNLFRTEGSLRQGLIVLMLSGALLGSFTLYQEATQSYSQQFWGFAQRNVEYGTGADAAIEGKEFFRDPDKIRLIERSGGPVGGPNRYAQNLLLLLPIAYFTIRAHKRMSHRILAGLCLPLILAGTLLTYSRGGFVGLVVIVLLMLAMRVVRARHVAFFAALLALAVVIWAPGYTLRIASLGGLQQVTGDVPAESDGVFRGRLTEMLAALNVFLDHPLVGVGPGQFTPVYSVAYMSDPEIAFRHLTVHRRAHTLYFELAAETGILGLVTFLGVVGTIQLRLWRAWRRWRGRREDLAGLAAGFFLAISSYLVTAIFLQLAYQRYYWLLLGLAGAALQILAREDRKAGLEDVAPPPRSPLVVYGGLERGPAVSSGASG
jgi:hypothetical protein